MPTPAEHYDRAEDWLEVATDSVDRPLALQWAQVHATLARYADTRPSLAVVSDISPEESGPHDLLGRAAVLLDDVLAGYDLGPAAPNLRAALRLLRKHMEG